MCEKYADLTELKDGRLRVRATTTSFIKLWNIFLLKDGYNRIDEVHLRPFSFFRKYPYEVNYMKAKK